MSWSQDYSVPSVEDLLLEFVDINLQELLEKELVNTHGLTILKTEDVKLEDDPWEGPIVSKRVFLSDGRIFEPKLVRRESADGNWGRHVYEYMLADERVEVEYVNLTDTNINCGDCGSDEHYCTCGNDNEGC